MWLYSIKPYLDDLTWIASCFKGLILFIYRFNNVLHGYVDMVFFLASLFSFIQGLLSHYLLTVKILVYYWVTFFSAMCAADMWHFTAAKDILDIGNEIYVCHCSWLVKSGKFYYVLHTNTPVNGYLIVYRDNGIKNVQLATFYYCLHKTLNFPIKTLITLFNRWCRKSKVF